MTSQAAARPHKIEFAWQRGFIKWFSLEKGYGFVRNGDREIFFSANSAGGDQLRMADGAEVVFIEGVDKSGRPRCEAIRLKEPK